MAEQESEKTTGVRGLVESPCRHCGEMIPKNTLACPGCGKRGLFNQDQYDRLRRSSEAHDMGEWNEWRERSFPEPVHLERADLHRAHLEGAYLEATHLEGANLMFAHLRGAHLDDGCLQGACLEGADLADVSLVDARLDGADVHEASLKRADLVGAHLERAYLFAADFECADLTSAHLEDAYLNQAHLEGATACGAVVNASTNLWNCRFDRRTNFTGVGLDAANIEPGLKSALQRNIRQIGWERWYEHSRARKWLFSLPVRAFWWVTDYGSSTWGIVIAFLALSLIFAIAYWAWAVLAPPGIVSGLLQHQGVPVGQAVVPLRAVYFSIVTMTTLGFGDMHAQPNSICGHVLLMIQVILGYMLLGALITRFAIMFQGTTVPHAPERR